jgi:hypothetical protein
MPRKTPARRIDPKDVNPKDRLGVKKIPFELCSTVAHVFWALAQGDGERKYGRDNWREKPVQEHIYLAAIERHVKRMRAGEIIDKVSGVPHAGHIMACAAIIEDARAAGCLIASNSAFDHGCEIMDLFTDEADYNKTAEQLAKSRTPCRTQGEVAGRQFAKTVHEAVSELAAAIATAPAKAKRK